LNTQQAEIIVLRVTLQTLFTRMISSRPEYAEEMLADLKDAATGALDRMEFSAESPESSARAKAIVQERAGQFFDDIALALSQVRTNRGQSGRN